MRKLFTILFLSIIFLASQHVSADVGGLGPVKGDSAESVESYRRDEERKKIKAESRTEMENEAINTIFPLAFVLIGIGLIIRSYKKEIKEI